MYEENALCRYRLSLALFLMIGAIVWHFLNDRKSSIGEEVTLRNDVQKEVVSIEKDKRNVLLQESEGSEDISKEEETVTTTQYHGTMYQNKNL